MNSAAASTSGVASISEIQNLLPQGTSVDDLAPPQPSNQVLLTAGDIESFCQGRHFRAYEKLGAHPATINGVLWPTGILPKLGQLTGDFAIVRSMRAHAVVHSLSQTWMQIGRNPTAALGNIAPNIGSVVAT